MRFHRAFAVLAPFLLPIALFQTAVPVQHHPPCANCATWNAPQKPFRIYGNTYYVGPHGLSVILITSDAGHILVDGALPESVPQIVANIRSLGFRIEDVKLIVNSHVHFDHAGGIAELQRLSGARVVASSWSAAVLRRGGVGADDPQQGVIEGIQPVANVETLRDREKLRVGDVELTAHITPDHTPGGTSWTWKSCESGRCLSIVYADSLTPVSADGFLFSKSPHGVQDFERSFAFLRDASCDILLSTHPDASSLWDRLAARQRIDTQGSAAPDPMIDPSACRALADRSASQLAERLRAERK